jgi:hypothetical protein
MRYVSFTFDDGAINGARKVHEILSPYKATFYIITGWVKPNNSYVDDKFNVDVDHGSLDDWKYLSEIGHDIGSHTATHKKGDYNRIEEECCESLEFLKKIHLGPYSISSPHHSFIKTSIFDSVRVGTYQTIHKKNGHEFNKLSCDLKEIYSCDENYQSLSSTVPQVSDDNIWFVMSYHSIDNEGFCPISSDDLRKSKTLFLDYGYQIKSVKEMICNRHHHI